MDPPSLVQMRYKPLPLGTVQPNGWIRDQLRLSAQGLGGSLFHFYRFVKSSTWLGGTWEYSPLNEAAPYWYNYIVPLAYSLDQHADAGLAADLKGQADQFLDSVLSHQADDGWLGPEETSKTRGIWARCLLLQGLMNHALADPSRRPRILSAILRFVRLVHRMLQNDYEGYLPKEGDQFDLQWFGVARAHELSTTLMWLHDEPEALGDRKEIWSVMEMLWEGARLAKRDWTVFFAKENFPRTPSVKGESLNFQHGVNVAQGLRYPAQLYRMYPSAGLSQLSKQAVARAFAFHGTPAGSLSSDEYIGGLSPQRGSELCCSVELMFSLAYLHQLFGDNGFADRVESAAYNAIPAGVSSDWWSHQYVTQVNQPWARELSLNEGEKTPFYDVCRYANVFGLEPEFPCCTVNHPTAYPKLLMHAFLELPGTDNPTIMHAYLLPSRLQREGISITCESNYPFAPCASHYSITADRMFKFLIRVPSWASSSSTIEFGSASPGASRHTDRFAPNAEGLADSCYCVSLPSGGDYTISLTIDSEVRVETHKGNSISIHYGPLLYAYEVEFREVTRLPRNYKDQVSDCEEIATVSGGQGKEAWKAKVRDHDYLPTSPWSIAVDPSQEIKVVAADPWLDRERGQIRPLTDPVWSTGASPVHVEVTAVEVDWPVKNGTAADPGEVDTSSASRRGEPFRARLDPYGTAKLHMAQFPAVTL